MLFRSVAAAVKRLKVTWPVAIDSEMDTWNAWENNVWPAEYLIDQNGKVAYTNLGEGDYDETAHAVEALLAVPAKTMGVLPLEFTKGSSATSLGLDGTESFSIRGIADATPGAILRVEVTKTDGSTTSFDAKCRLDSETDIEYYRAGGILPMVLDQLLLN